MLCIKQSLVCLIQSDEILKRIGKVIDANFKIVELVHLNLTHDRNDARTGAKAIYTYLMDLRANKWLGTVSAKEIEKFQRKNLTKQLADVLNEVVHEA